MNTHERIYETVAKFRIPATAAQIQSEIPTLSYAVLHNTLNELVRNGRIIESRNELGKRVFTAKAVISPGVFNLKGGDAN